MYFRFYKPLFKKVVKNQEILIENSVFELKCTIRNGYADLTMLNEKQEEIEFNDNVYFSSIKEAATKMSKYIVGYDAVNITCRMKEDILEFKIVVNANKYGRDNPERMFFVQLQSYSNIFRRKSFKVLKAVEGRPMEFFPFSLYDDYENRPYV